MRDLVFDSFDLGLLSSGELFELAFELAEETKEGGDVLERDAQE
jgi:hypothetical protein